ncbi:MAG: 4a-hydroxytetrahydrobiopterin dehydratase [Candidatus Kapaibacteriales bacterium]
MTSHSLLSKEEINQKLTEVPLWTFKENSLTKELVAPDFISAIGLVNSIAIIAEKLDHHPDILIYGWNKVRIITSTHSVGGLTEMDFLLAKEIDSLGLIKG